MTTTPQAALLREAAQNALTTLDGIANANPRDKADFETPSEWIAWAKSRARFAADALREPISREVYAERILKQMLREASEPQAEKKCGTCGFIGQEDPVKGCPKCGFDDMRAMRQTTLLTRQEMLAAILPLTDSNAAAEIILDISADEYRAIEAAIIAKLQATQEPVQAGELPGEREAFEAEMRCVEEWGHRSLKKRTNGRYENWQVDLMWDVWQARAALAARRPLTPKPVTASAWR